jgi:NADH-quinone oxidoreductase subunit N
MHQIIPFIPGYLDDALSSLGFFIPEMYLCALFILLLFNDMVLGASGKMLGKIVACIGVIVIIGRDLSQWTLLKTSGLLNGKILFSGMLLINHPVIEYKVIIDVLALLLLMYLSWDDHLARHRKGLGDMYSIMAASLLGLHLMVMAINLVSIYLSIEMVSIASYLLVAYRSESKFSTEAGLKYVLFGAASSAVMLYGISVLYALTGSFDLYNGQVPFGLLHAHPVAVAFGLIMLLAGVGFKLSFVPMHFWVPDIYQGAPTPVTAWLSTLPKIAGFALLINFLLPFVLMVDWHVFDYKIFLAVIGIVTMIAGNFAAVLQTNVKRLLAYSSIAHTGFVLIGIAAYATPSLDVKPAIAYYLFVYGLATIGAFVLASYFSNLAGAEDVDSYKGLGFKYPVASISFVIILISLTGIPVTAGFTGKLFVFSAAYGVYQNTHNVWLLTLMITGALTTVVSLFYYLKVPLNLFIKRMEITHESPQKAVNLLVLSVIVAVLLILLGIFPGVIYNNL